VASLLADKNVFLNSDTYEITFEFNATASRESLAGTHLDICRWAVN
jgi:hypothetical protein